MIEADYNKWLLREKTDIENFDKLSEHLQKEIYKLEQELTDNEEVELSKIYFSDDNEFMELEFSWLGHGLECVRAGRVIYEACEWEEDREFDEDDFYEIGEESVDRAGFEMMHEKILNRLHPHVSYDNIMVVK